MTLLQVGVGEGDYVDQNYVDLGAEFNTLSSSIDAEARINYVLF